MSDYEELPCRRCGRVWKWAFDKKSMPYCQEGYGCAVAPQSRLEMKLQDYEVLVKALFQILNKTEETEDGRSFHPNQLRSCRALDAEKLDKILAQLKNMVEGNNT
jgi:hypothetical protein